MLLEEDIGGYLCFGEIGDNGEWRLLLFGTFFIYVTVQALQLFFFSFFFF